MLLNIGGNVRLNDTKVDRTTNFLSALGKKYGGASLRENRIVDEEDIEPVSSFEEDSCDLSEDGE